MPRSDIRIALRTLDFDETFPADSWKINNLTQTVDQEVGGSNPPSCTKYLAGKVRNRCDIWCKVPVSTFAPLDLVMRQTPCDNPAWRLDRRHDVVVASC
jgi:hypothetical protein